MERWRDGAARVVGECVGVYYFFFLCVGAIVLWRRVLRGVLGLPGLWSAALRYSKLDCARFLGKDVGYGWGCGFWKGCGRAGL